MLVRLPESLMSYYPILPAPGCSGWTTLYNFAPNNWEEGARLTRYVNVTWADGRYWHTRNLARLQYGALKTVHAVEVAGLMPDASLPLLSLTDFEPSPVAERLPPVGSAHASYPAWRATLGLLSESGAKSCYQGELDPFPAPGSLLTFGQFLQFGKGIDNYLLFLNIESDATQRNEQIEIRNAASPERLLARFPVKNNSVNPIRLDFPDTAEEDLLLITCKGMSGVPLYFSRSEGGGYLSLEHSHPPASSVIHGRRWEAQKLLKQRWFAKVGAK